VTWGVLEAGQLEFLERRIRGVGTATPVVPGVTGVSQEESSGERSVCPRRVPVPAASPAASRRVPPRPRSFRLCSCAAKHAGYTDVIEAARSVWASESLIRGLDRAVGELCGSYNNAKVGTGELRRKMQRKVDNLKSCGGQNKTLGAFAA